MICENVPLKKARIRATSHRYDYTVSTHPLDLDDVLGREGAPVVLVPRQQFVHGRPLAVHQRVHAVLDLPAVLIELQINCD